MSTPRLHIAPLTRDDIPELEAALRNDDVYRHIGGMPTPDRFQLGTERAIAGPPAHRISEIWLNYAVRLREGNELIGRLEATIHDGVAEVAFLFGSTTWGKGYATEGMQWLHALLAERSEKPALWATTLPDNRRSVALLRRCGYAPVDPKDAPRLLTYDEGDLVFKLPRP